MTDTLELIMNNETVLAILNSQVTLFVAIFFAGMVASTLGTLKTIFLSKSMMKPVYITLFIDGIVFSQIVKQISANGFLLSVVYSFGKVFGAWIASRIEKKLALGNYEITLVLSNKNKMRTSADTLRLEGFSVDTGIVGGLEGEKRYNVITSLPRRDVGKYYQILNDIGIQDPSTKTVQLKNLKGKLAYDKPKRKGLFSKKEKK